MIKTIFHKLLGRDPKSTEIIQRKQEEATEINRIVKKDLENLSKELDDVNKKSNEDLSSISRKMKDITHLIAYGTGGKKRGLI